jgi:membrane dipeptidase
MKSLRAFVADSLGLPWSDWSQFRSLDASQQALIMENYPRILEISDNLASNRTDAPPAVDVSDFVDHIDYMVQKIGIDHVGISSDFDGGGGISGWADASETFNVTLELVKRGYSEEDIRKLWGGNLLRVLDEVQEVAKNWTNS